MSNNTFQKNLKAYANLITEVGVNVKESDTVVLQIDIDQAELARLIVASAYEKGASEVIVKWGDDQMERLALEKTSEERLSQFPEWRTAQMNYWLDHKASRISVISSDPNALSGVDSNRINLFQKTMGKGMMPLRKATQANEVSWTVVAAAGAEWAKLVFPELASNDEQVQALWTEIFKTTRIDQANPIEAWHLHDEKLRAKAAELNAEQFDRLHYTAPGTDFVIGLPKNHLWEGAGSFNASGVEFMANMPTEEVFTAPDSRRIDGHIVSTKPLSYAGTTISGMRFEFKDGKVVSATAEEGNAVLQDLLAIDDGAKSLGEVALVPDPSPISQSGITFFNTLFDENASNHLALGSAYAFSLQNGTKMSEEELEAAGLNRSQTHVDFMVGSAKMDIDGIKEDGTIIPIFRNGNWAES